MFEIPSFSNGYVMLPKCAIQCFLIIQFDMVLGRSGCFWNTAWWKPKFFFLILLNTRLIDLSTKNKCKGFPPSQVKISMIMFTRHFQVSGGMTCLGCLPRSVLRVTPGSTSFCQAGTWFAFEAFIEIASTLSVRTDPNRYRNHTPSAKTKT